MAYVSPNLAHFVGRTASSEEQAYGRLLSIIPHQAKTQPLARYDDIREDWDELAQIFPAAKGSRMVGSLLPRPLGALMGRARQPTRLT
jgi:hypothetical protein